MATKKLLGLLDSGKTATIGSADTATVAGDLSVTLDLDVGGDLNVTGSIVSSGTTNVVVTDAFLDLANGETTTAGGPAGYTAQVQAGATVKYFVKSVTSNVITLTDDVSGAISTFDTGQFTAASAAAAGDSFTLTAGGGGTNLFTAITSGVPDVDEYLAVDGDATATAGNMATQINNNENFRAYNVGTIVFIQLVAANTSGAIANTNNTPIGTITTFGPTPLMTAERVISVSGATDQAANNGLFSVDTVNFDGDNGKITLNTLSVDSAPFLQTAMDDTDADETDSPIVFPNLYVQAVSDGVNIKKSGGAIIAKGSLCDTFQELPLNTSFVNAYSAVGAGEVTLQDAYEAGSTVTMNATGANVLFDLNINGNFVITGDDGVGDVLIGQGGAEEINEFKVQADNLIELATEGTGTILIQNEGVNALDDGIKVATTFTNPVSNLGLGSQTAALSIESDGGISMLANKASAIYLDNTSTAAAALTIGAGGPDPTSVQVIADDVANTIRIVGSESVIDANDAVMIGPNLASALITIGEMPLTTETITVDSTTIGGAHTITFTGAGGTSANFDISDNANIDITNDDTDTAMVADAIKTLLNTITGYNANNPTGTTDVNMTVDLSATFVNDSNDDLTVGGTAFDGTIVNSTSDNASGIGAYRADADASFSTYSFAGICSKGDNAGQDIEIDISGVGLQAATGVVTAGQMVYVSNTPGEAVAVPTTTAGDTVFQIGMALANKAGGGAGTVKVLLQPQFIAELA
jgi:hypothetical protein